MDSGAVYAGDKKRRRVSSATTILVPLIEAAAKGDADVVAELLFPGASAALAASAASLPNVNGKHKGTCALIRAAAGGHLRVVALLVAAGSDLNATEARYGRTALMRAVEKEHMEVVALLTAAGADLEVADKKGKTAIGWASTNHTFVENNNMGIVAALVAGGANQTQLAAHLRTAFSVPPCLASAPREVKALWAGCNPIHIVPDAHATPATILNWINSSSGSSSTGDSGGGGSHGDDDGDTQLMTVLGFATRWVAAAMPGASRDKDLKQAIFTIASHCHNLALGYPDAAARFFTAAFVQPASAELERMPTQLHLLARELGVTEPLAPAALIHNSDDTTARNTCLAFMDPKYATIVSRLVEGTCIELSVLRDEAVAAATEMSGVELPKHLRGARRKAALIRTYTKSAVRQLPTVAEVHVAALCLTATFMNNHLQSTRPGLLQQGNNLGLITWPGPKRMARMYAKVKEDYSDCDQPWSALLDALRFSLVSETTEQLLAFVSPFVPSTPCSTGAHEHAEFDDVAAVAAVGTDGTTEFASTAAQAAVPKNSSSRSKPAVANDPELVATRAKCTMNDPFAAVKQELWNLKYSPAGLTFGSMVGGLQPTEVDRWKTYGDVQFARSMKNRVMVDQPINVHFADAVAEAKEANPEVSGYTWLAALRLLASGEFVDKQVSMMVEVQLYLEDFLKYRKEAHCYYKVLRAPHMASFAQDCQHYSLNPKIAYAASDDNA